MALDPVTAFVAMVMAVSLLPALATGYVFARYANLFARLRMLGGPLGVDRWAALGPTLVFLVGFGWLSVTDALPDGGESLGAPVFLALLGFGAGLFGVAVALGNLGRYRRLRGEDFAAGTAAVDADATEAPLSGESCLAWSVRVREHSGLFRRGPAPTVHRESGGTTFVVESGTERVRVDPSEATLRVWPVGGTGRTDFAARHRDGSVPDRVEAYETDIGLGDPDRSSVAEEMRIEAGDAVTVLGSADREGHAVGGPETLIIDDSLARVRRRTRRSVQAGPVGLALAAVSFLAAALLTGAL